MQTTTEKIEFIGYLIRGEINLWNLKIYILRKKAKKVKKHNNFTFYDYIEQCRS